ncbi:MAG: hypothetical protein CSA97_02435 [Bacteroidetes bacterium]|nr:MAG: hypothetical protein CSA97_02435 [Bacteroidota bacterium]
MRIFCLLRLQLLAIASLFIGGTAYAEGYTLRQRFATPDSLILELTVEEYTLAPHPSGATIPRIEGAPTASKPTDPELPDITVAYTPSSPKGLRVYLLSTQPELLGQYDIAPAQARTRSRAFPSGRRQRGLVYQGDALFPYTPYRLSPVARSGRSYRQSLALSPFAWHPRTQDLRLNRKLRLAVAGIAPKDEAKPTTRGASRAPHYPDPASTDYMLIVLAARFEGQMDAYISFKSSRGLRSQTLIYGASTSPLPHVATQAELIAKIKELYDRQDGLRYLLLVGSREDIPPIIRKGTKGRMVGCDQPYGWIAGDDAYPELRVGRFSAYTLDQLRTQLQRTMDYEAGHSLYPSAYANALALASADPGGGDNGETDSQHQDLIAKLLADHGYAHTFKAYDPSANAPYITSVLNHGVGLINYSGHGLPDRWSTGGFTNDNTKAISNPGAYPLVFSVACLNGNMDTRGCFAEQWLWAGTPTQPYGAIAFLGSSDDLPWDPPMLAQDAFNQLLTGSDPATQLHTLGDLLVQAFTTMLDKYGASSKTDPGYLSAMAWNLFGDPSLILRTPCSTASSPISSQITPANPAPLPLLTSWATAPVDPSDPSDPTGPTDPSDPGDPAQPSPSGPTKPKPRPKLEPVKPIPGGRMTPVAPSGSQGVVRVYPNPVGSTLFVSLPASCDAGGGLRLYSPSGQLLLSAPVPRSRPALIPIAMGAFPSGFYVLRIGSQAYTIMKR